jgi:hypothetical protein
VPVVCVANSAVPAVSVPPNVFVVPAAAPVKAEVAANLDVLPV